MIWLDEYSNSREFEIRFRCFKPFINYTEFASIVLGYKKNLSEYRYQITLHEEQNFRVTVWSGSQGFKIQDKVKDKNLNPPDRWNTVRVVYIYPSFLVFFTLFRCILLCGSFSVVITYWNRFDSHR